MYPISYIVLEAGEEFAGNPALADGLAVDSGKYAEFVADLRELEHNLAVTYSESTPRDAAIT